MDHNSIIASAGKTALVAIGMKRKGRSRLWYDDHGWWAIVVEFQPSSWNRGSYLNVGLSWMLYEKAGWSFDIGYREAGFVSVGTEEQFEAAMADMSALAARRVIDFRRRFSSLTLMYDYYAARGNREGWPDYYAGILAALSGENRKAEQHFAAVGRIVCTVDWQHALRMRSEELMRLVSSREEFRARVLGIVLGARAARGLVELAIEAIGLP